MNRLAVAAGLVLAWAAPAHAVTNTLSESISVQTNQGSLPGDAVVSWTHHVDTSPAGQMPNTSSSFGLSLPTDVGAGVDPGACDPATIDGRAGPAACTQVGSGEMLIFIG